MQIAESEATVGAEQRRAGEAGGQQMAHPAVQQLVAKVAGMKAEAADAAAKAAGLESKNREKDNKLGELECFLRQQVRHRLLRSLFVGPHFPTSVLSAPMICHYVFPPEPSTLALCSFLRPALRSQLGPS